MRNTGSRTQSGFSGRLSNRETGSGVSGRGGRRGREGREEGGWEGRGGKGVGGEGREREGGGQTTVGNVLNLPKQLQYLQSLIMYL